MSLENLKNLDCATAFVAGFEAKWKRRQTDVLEALEYLHTSGLTEPPACIIAGNRALAEAVAAPSGRAALGQHLNLYFQHVDALTEADQDAIRAVIIAADPTDQPELCTAFIYLNLLRIDMRGFLETRALDTVVWEGIAVEDNAHFHMLLHNGLFGGEYQSEFAEGLRSIMTANQIEEYLTEMAQIKPQGYETILQPYLSDTRMTQPDFLNPESIGQIARQLLVTDQ